MPNHGSSSSSPDLSYTVRISSRARYARLKISPHEGLVVVIPEGFDTKLVPGIVESRMEWIVRVQRSFDRRRLVDLSDTGAALPSMIDLAGIGETWRVTYRSQPRQGVSVRESGADELVVAGAVHEQALCRSALERWLKRRAESKLVPQLVRLAAIHDFSISAVSVRKQKTRWGSCSSRGRVSLNLKLLFLPPLLVRYIMVHELCHTLHMNHSARYWKAVARFDPDYLLHDREMKHAWRYVPGWIAISC
ncbi:MAG TPA: SprT family zinc-dependent metalloprotease [Chlorobaculum sp.]|nr:SprT family zinc-dependent metalloprotease [Chlorobaculum sp.]